MTPAWIFWRICFPGRKSCRRNATKRFEYDQRGSNLEPRQLFRQRTHGCAFTLQRKSPADFSTGDYKHYLPLYHDGFLAGHPSNMQYISVSFETWKLLRFIFDREEQLRNISLILVTLEVLK